MTDLTAPIALIACAVALIAWGFTAVRLTSIRNELEIERGCHRISLRRLVALQDELTATKAQITRLTTRGKDGKFVKVAG